MSDLAPNPHFIDEEPYRFRPFLHPSLCLLFSPPAPAFLVPVISSCSFVQQPTPPAAPCSQPPYNHSILCLNEAQLCGE